MNNLNSPVDYVPEHCNAWQDFYETDKFPYWWYKNSDGQKMFIVVRQPRPGAKRKACVQGSYDGIKKRYVKENLWAKIEDFKLPLLRLPELIKTELPILITEGEGKCDKAHAVFRPAVRSARSDVCFADSCANSTPSRFLSLSSFVAFSATSV